MLMPVVIYPIQPDAIFSFRFSVAKMLGYNRLFSRIASSTQASPDKVGGVSSYSPCLFGKGIVVHIQQTKTFTKTKLI